MEDEGFTDENVAWTCLPSTPEQSERFKFDVHISSIISSFMSHIMTKTVFRVSDQIQTNGAVHCTLYSGHKKGSWLEISYLVSKGIGLPMLQNANVLTNYAETT